MPELVESASPVGGSQGGGCTWQAPAGLVCSSIALWGLLQQDGCIRSSCDRWIRSQDQPGGGLARCINQLVISLATLTLDFRRL